MKKLLLVFSVLISSFSAYSQCEIPQPFTGNTGSNMTVMLTPDFISSVTVTSEDAYIVGITPAGMVVASTSVFGVSQTSLAVWGDDTDSPELDGAMFGEDISLQLVDGSSLYDLTISSPVTYSTNGMVVQGSPVTADLCGGDVLGGDCEYPGIYSGNTGNNMTVMLTPGFMSGLQITDENAYISVSSGGMLVGSVDVYGVSQTSLAIWGDDSSTPETDGAVLGVNVVMQLVDGSNLFILNTIDIPFVVNGTQILMSLDSQVLTCGVVDIEGCMEEWAENFNQAANVSDDSCELTGCMDSEANNYVELANVASDCVYLGCTNSNACNYDAQANNDDDSCFFNEVGYDCDGVCLIDSDGDGVCDGFEVLGCIDDIACNYNELATDAGFCTYPSEDWLNCEEQCNNDVDNDGVCDEFEIDGCIDPTAFNYNDNATNDDGSCIAIALGCTNETATNFDASANTDNGSCLVEGCTDASAFNFNADANINDGSCEAVVEGCTDFAAANFDESANIDNGSCEDVAFGCTDSNALNYDSNANTNDDSCEYLSFSGNWPSSADGIINTGNNSTIGVSADLDLEDGDYLGAFYESDGELVCGGLLFWDADAVNQLIVVWGNDANSEVKDGFDSGEQIVWKSRDVSADVDASLYPIYSLGTNTYMVNAAYIITGWILDPEFGCMDAAYEEFSSSALVADGSCSILWSSLYVVQADELAAANVVIDELSTDLLNLNNTLSMTILSMQSDFDNMVLDYQGQLFILETTLTDSLNDVHASYTSDINALNSAWDLEVEGLEYELVVLNQGLVDSISSYELQLADLHSLMSGDVSDLEAAIASLQSDSLDLENLLAATILDYDSQIATLNSSWDTEVAGLNADIDGLNTDLANTISSYDTQIANLISSYDAEILAINATHDLIVESLNGDAAVAADAALDLLNLTIDNYTLDLETMEFGYESQLATLIANYDNTIAILNANDASEDADYEEHVANLQSDSTQFELDLSIANANIESLDTDVANLQADNSDLSENLAYHSAPLYVNLNQGWNMIGFPLQEEMDAAASLEILGADLHLIKNNNAAVYWPEFGFNSLGTLVPGQGYQVRMYGAHDDYTFPYIIGERLDVYPQVPTWAIEMEIPSHPNETPTLVRVVNMLGQEVVPEDVFDGEVLLYLYSDGTVEKAIK